jgi:hypothetical protein
LDELLLAERELTTDELTELRHLNERYWTYIQNDLNLRAHQTYAVAAPTDFRRCIVEHMSMSERIEMLDADVYTCPECHRLLKDRNTPVASAILLERRRIRELWQAAETAPAGTGQEAIARFRRAIGE